MGTILAWRARVRHHDPLLVINDQIDQFDGDVVVYADLRIGHHAMSAAARRTLGAATGVRLAGQWSVHVVSTNVKRLSTRCQLSA